MLLIGALGILFDAQMLTHELGESTEATLKESLALSTQAIEQDPANAENQRLHSLNCTGKECSTKRSRREPKHNKPSKTVGAFAKNSMMRHH